jgi:hypothetical protein
LKNSYLIYLENEVDFNEFQKITEHFKNNKIVICTTNFKLFINHYKKFANIFFFNPTLNIISNDIFFLWLNYFFFKIVSKYLYSKTSSIFINKILVYVFKKFKLKIKNFIIKFNFDFFYTYTDRSMTGVPQLLLEILKEFNIKSSIPQSAYLRIGKNLIHYRNDNFVFSNFLSKKIEKFFINHNNIKICFFTKNLLFIFYNLNILKGNPWINGGSNMVDLVCVDGIFSKNRLINHNIKSKNIFISGSSQFKSIKKDNIFNKEKFKLNLEKKNLNIFYPIPQYYEHGFCDLNQQKKIISNALDILSGYGNIYFSYHPKSIRKNYDFFTKNNTKLIEVRGIESELNHIDLFVCYHSALTRLALVSKIPLIILNLFKEGYVSDYPKKSCFFCNDLNELSDKLKKINLDDLNYEEALYNLDFTLPF